MASRENSEANGKTASELKLIDEETSHTRVLASIDWNLPPLCWLSAQQQNLLKNQSETQRFRLGEKIWPKDGIGYQFLIVSGKVRLREEGVGKPLATLQAGDWFGDLQKFPIECKAVAASKDVVVVRWNSVVWAELSTPEIEEFWQRGAEDEETRALDIGQGAMGNGQGAMGNGQGALGNGQGALGNGQGASGNGQGALDIGQGALGIGQGAMGNGQGVMGNGKKTNAQSPMPNPQSPIPNASAYPFVSNWNTGAACLTMVAQQLDNPVKLEWVQRQLRGQRPKQLVDAAEKLGFVLRRLQVNWSDLQKLSFPALLQWGKDGSWVVAYGLKGDRLIIANPLNSDRTCEILPPSLVQENWDGLLWVVEPIQKQETFNLSWFLPAVWKYKGLLTEVLLASLTLQILGLTTPLITQVVIDKVMVQESLPTLDVMAIALLLVAIFEAMLGILRLFIFTHTARRLDLSLSAQLFRHLMRLPLAYFEARRVGDTVARVQELEQIRQFLTGTALTVVLDSIFAVVYLALMFYYNISLTLTALAVLPLFAALTLVATPILRNWLNETFNRSADSQSFLVETVTGIHSVKAHAAEPVARDRWEGLFARFIRTGFKASTTSNISSNIGDFLTNFSSLLILWFGAKLVIENKLTIGQLVAFQMLSGRVTGPLLRLVQLWQNLQQVLLSVDRIGDILNVAPEAEPGTGLVLPNLKGQITFEQVFFRYRQNTEPVLRGISFTVQPGQFIGIVGRSGSGKSTLSKLLQRLYQIESGRILIDGFDIKSADLTSLRQQIGVVLQEDFLFNGSILENITLGNPEITAEEVVEAARLAVAHDFISELPHGYETNVGERGTALSGGQRQRIALARLFLSQAPILILDEATSALDSETEQQVLQNLQKVSQGRTVFLIAHRFAPLKRADLILVLEKGVLAERGTHTELLQQKGLYWSLYQRQQFNI